MLDVMRRRFVSGAEWLLAVACHAHGAPHPSTLFRRMQIRYETEGLMALGNARHSCQHCIRSGGASRQVMSVMELGDR